MRYTDTTIIQVANKRGSSAKTRAGAWKYLLAHLSGPSKKTCSAPWEHEAWRENRWERKATRRAEILGYALDDPNTPGRVADREERVARQTEADRSLHLTRNTYGQLLLTSTVRADEPRPEIAIWREAQTLLARAGQAGIIEAAYDGIAWDRRGRSSGTALHHEIYDAAPGALILCVRQAEGSRYGVNTSAKTYYLIAQSEEGELAAQPIDAPVAKYAKLPSVQLGSIIAHLTGEQRLSLASPVIHGYKAVRVEADGSYTSVWDQSPWPIGTTRVERVAHDHEGGYYYYRSLDTLISAARNSEIFGASCNHHRLAIVAVRAEGRQIAYGEKYAASRITIVEQIGSLL